ncbi:MAG: DUF896 domain-containing protein [Gracilibacteraceae bacterium]|jgi:5-formyltetrahydrofolate cyclo-ligase|nr:DUF896 domain-containing protein [Gracilibacteraceae bacterium]
MDQTKIDRINALARKSRGPGLSDEEIEEQKRLRREYAAAFRNNLEAMLEQTYFVDEEGHKTKLLKKHDVNGTCPCDACAGRDDS